ncbi:MAG: hypothetical protein HYW23_02210 [Candidatus Aenigmarchaeota archaeon]|nr:hypothetical protein [Candidatus Aenigmarchaeota archaeon]
MQQAVQRTREHICDYLTPKEKLERYSDWRFPRQFELQTPYHLIDHVRGLTGKQSFLLPSDYEIMPGGDFHSFARYGPAIMLWKKEKDFIKEVKHILNVFRPQYTARGFGWVTADRLMIYPLLSAVDGLVLYEVFSGSMPVSGNPKERIKVSLNYNNAIMCEVPSRSLSNLRSHMVRIEQPPTQKSNNDWQDTFLRHMCHHTTYQELGSGQVKLDEHVIAGCYAAGVESAKRGDPFKTNFVLPITREFADIVARLINRVLKYDRSLKSRSKTGKGGIRNLREEELEYLLQSYVKNRQHVLQGRVADSLLYDDLETLRREQAKDNYIMGILRPA